MQTFLPPHPHSQIAPGTHTLLVDDDRAYAHLVQHALRQTLPGRSCHHVSDGEAALDYVRGRGAYADRSRFPLPGVVILDLRMPRVDGYEVLRELKSDPATQAITVVVMTSSDLARDRQRCHECGADRFVTKSGQLEQLAEDLRSIYISPRI